MRVLNVQSDYDHNRSVITVVGEPEALVNAVFDAVRIAADLIDLRRHEGAHPRLGATDVVAICAAAGHSPGSGKRGKSPLARRVADELGIPVYFYEESATSPERQNLESIRQKGFEELRDKIGVDPKRQPDLGPAAIHESAGAVVIGARRPLIAYNIYLETQDISIAKAIARVVRHSTGGLRYVKALGFSIPERACVQVSMNLTNYERSSLHTVFELVRSAAQSYGVSIRDSEIVGTVPAAALLDVARHYLRLHEFSNNQVLEMCLLENQVAAS